MATEGQSNAATSYTEAELASPEYLLREEREWILALGRYEDAVRSAATTRDDLAFLAAMLELIPNGHATASEYERLVRLAEPYLAARFKQVS